MRIITLMMIMLKENIFYFVFYFEISNKMLQYENIYTDIQPLVLMSSYLSAVLARRHINQLDR